MVCISPHGFIRNFVMTWYSWFSIRKFDTFCIVRDHIQFAVNCVSASILVDDTEDPELSRIKAKQHVAKDFEHKVDLIIQGIERKIAKKKKKKTKNE